MGSHCSTARSWQLTRRWSASCGETAHPGRALIVKTELPSRQRSSARQLRIQSCRATVQGPNWLWLLWRPEAGGARRPGSSFACSLGAGPARSQDCSGRPLRPHGAAAGQASWHVRRHAPLQGLCCSGRWEEALTERCPAFPTWLTRGTALLQVAGGEAA